MSVSLKLLVFFTICTILVLTHGYKANGKEYSDESIKLAEALLFAKSKGKYVYKLANEELESGSTKITKHNIDVVLVAMMFGEMKREHRELALKMITSDSHETKLDALKIYFDKRVVPNMKIEDFRKIFSSE